MAAAGGDVRERMQGEGETGALAGLRQNVTQH